MMFIVDGIVEYFCSDIDPISDTMVIDHIV